MDVINYCAWSFDTGKTDIYDELAFQNSKKDKQDGH